MSKIVAETFEIPRLFLKSMKSSYFAEESVELFGANNILTRLILELLRCCVDFLKRQYHQRLYQRLREYGFEHITISRGVNIGCNICLHCF